MPRPKKKQLEFERDSLLSLMQEVYNECVEQRNTAIRIQNKMLGFMKDPTDLTLLGPVIKEQQKIIDSAIEKKIQLSKLQANILQKNTNTSATATLTIEDRESLNSLLNRPDVNDEDNDKEQYSM